MSVTQQHMRRTFTPAFKNAFKDLASLAGTTPERLAAQQQNFTSEQRRETLNRSFDFLQSIPSNTPGIVNKMTAFLAALNNAAVNQKLEEIQNVDNETKFRELKTLLRNEEVRSACANEWNLYVNSL
jgi:hypothetical protein